MYVQNPSIEKSGVSHSASASISTLIAKYASPNVMMMSGSVRIARIGLMIVLPIVRMAAAKSSDPQRPIDTLENIQSTTISARMLTPQRMRSAIQIICGSACCVRLEELLELHGRTHVALDLQLAGHVRRRRVLLAGDDLLEVLLARGEGGVGI